MALLYFLAVAAVITLIAFRGFLYEIGRIVGHAWRVLTRDQVRIRFAGLWLSEPELAAVMRARQTSFRDRLLARLALTPAGYRMPLAA